LRLGFAAHFMRPTASIHTDFYGYYEGLYFLHWSYIVYLQYVGTILTVVVHQWSNLLCKTT